MYLVPTTCTPRPSRSTNAPWRSSEKSLGTGSPRTSPTILNGLANTIPAAKANTPRPRRSTNAPWRSARKIPRAGSPTHRHLPPKTRRYIPLSQDLYAKAEPLFLRALGDAKRNPSDPATTSAPPSSRLRPRQSIQITKAYTPKPSRSSYALLAIARESPSDTDPPRHRHPPQHYLALLYQVPRPIRQGRAALTTRLGDQKRNPTDQPPPSISWVLNDLASSLRGTRALRQGRAALATRSWRSARNPSDRITQRTASFLISLANLYQLARPIRQGRAALATRLGDPRESPRL